MIIFNQGKYKSIYAAQGNELEQLAQVVSQDKQWRPSYHIAPPIGLLNDPNGLVFDGEQYHIFYQWYPYDALHGMKHWMHLVTKDFQHFTYKSKLVPCQLFESHGCYSGGAVLVNDLVTCFYTGNTKRVGDIRVPFQNIALFSKEGKILAKTVVLDKNPQGYTGHVRDPKPYFTKDGKLRFILGAQRENETGTALVYELDNINELDSCIHTTLNGFPCYNGVDHQDHACDKQLKSVKERLGKDQESLNHAPVDPTTAHDDPAIRALSLPTQPGISSYLVGELSLNGFDNTNVFMWECPDLLQMKDQATNEIKDVFVWSPQGKVRQPHHFQNNYHNTYAVGKLNNLDFNVEACDELDYGHDFYASQTFANIKDRTILMAWVGLPDLGYVTDKYKWHSMLTMPRELTLVNNHLYQRPIKEIYQGLHQKQELTLAANQEVEVSNLTTSYIKVEGLSKYKEFSLELFANAKGEKLVFNFANGLFTLDRSHTQHTETMLSLGNKRYVELDQLDDLEIFVDNSVVEVFINNGYRAMTSRFFIDNASNKLVASQEAKVTVAQVQGISLSE